MSNRAITWAYKQTTAAGKPLKGGAKFVLVTLADMADSEHSCFPSIDQLTELTGIAPATVRQHITDLITAGLLTREARRRRDGSRTSNRYYLDVDGALTATQNQQPESGDGQAPDSRQINRQILEGSKENPQVNPHSSTPVVPTLDLGSEHDTTTHPTVDDLFDAFWTIWPRKEAKKTARRAFDKALAAARHQLRNAGVPLGGPPSNADAAHLITTAAAWWARCWAEIEHRPIDRIPHPSTWLNGERWTDQRPTAEQFTERRTPTRTEQNMAVVARYAAAEASQPRELES
jgi:DNA-binding transcriptional ArsR family regulator